MKQTFAINNGKPIVNTMILYKPLLISEIVQINYVRKIDGISVR